MSDTLRELISGWQSSLQPPDDGELEGQIRLIEAAMLDNQRLGYEVYSHLSRYPETDAQEVLDAFHKEQAALAARFGELMLEWRRRGGNFDLRKRGEPKVVPRTIKVEAPRSEARDEDEDDDDDDEDDASPDTLGPGSETAAQREAQEARVSADAIRAWKEALQKKQAAPVSRPMEVPETQQRKVLLTLMNTIGEIREVNSMVNIIDEIDGLEKITSPEYRAQWAMMSKPMQRAWLAMLVARTRSVKDATTTNPGLRERIKTFILQFPAYAKTYQPGYVNGLQVSHNPESHSWREDAVQFWAQLKQMTVAPPTPIHDHGEEESVPAPPVAPPSSSVVASAPSEEEDGPAIDTQWPLWPLVRDKKGILLGGEPREPARVRLENAFAMEALEWIPGDNPRRLDSVVERVMQNKVDIVFVLQQWTAHKVTNKLIDACKSSGVPWALVGSYSIKAIRAGLDRFLGAAREASSS